MIACTIKNTCVCVSRWMCVGLWLAVIAVNRPVRAQVDYEQPPISYLTASVHDPVAQLQQRLERHETQLEFADRHGYLLSVLKALDVPVSSQVLVFSKTSFQAPKISPRRPRAIYFNDNAYIGWVQRGDVVEMAAIDPQQGAIFYTLDQQRDGPAVITRQTHNCLVCHASSNTEGVPGLFVRSIFADHSGQPVLKAGSYRTDYTSPLRERWGGWYVTGTHGAQRHMGNAMLAADSDPQDLDVESVANLVDLATRFNVSPYVTPHSDIVALMVLEHQLAMHNRLTAANYSARITARDAQVMNEALGQDQNVESESTRRRYDTAAARVVEGLLFVGEAALTDPVAGTSRFAAEFAERGPCDAQGRSLRQFDLRTRLFRYPCSYLIYSDAFDALPAPVRDRVLRRLWSVLTGNDTSETLQHLSAGDRADILAILRATKQGLPDYWQAQ